MWNVKGRDHLQGVILHGLAQIQQLQNTTQRDRSDVGTLTEDFPSAPNHSQGLKFSTTQEVIVSNKPVSSLKISKSLTPRSCRNLGFSAKGLWVGALSQDYLGN